MYQLSISEGCKPGIIENQSSNFTSFARLCDGQMVDVQIFGNLIGETVVKIGPKLFTASGAGQTYRTLAQAVIEHVERTCLRWFWSTAVNQIHKLDDTSVESFHGTRDLFDRQFGNSNFERIPGGSELGFVVADFSTLTIACFTEGDIKVERCKTKRAFDASVSHVRAFYDYYA